MQLPAALRNAIENVAATYGVKELCAAANGFSEEYRRESVSGGRVVVSGVQTAAYAVARMPATFAAISRALQISGAADGCRTMLDVGSGTGAAVWAALSNDDEIENITCLERERGMIDMSRTLIENNCNGVNVEWHEGDITTFRPDKTYDTVVAAYSLNELSESERIIAARMLLGVAAKTFLIVEPGTPANYARLMRIREALTACGAHVIAPCPTDAQCRLPKDDWCHFSVRVERTRLHKLLKGGEAPFEDEKFSFLAISREAVAQSPARILRHPVINAGRIDLRLCTSDGITDEHITKREKAAFRAARKAESGDAFEME